jgi:hypothetical protein
MCLISLSSLKCSHSLDDVIFLNYPSVGRMALKHPASCRKSLKYINQSTKVSGKDYTFLDEKFLRLCFVNGRSITVYAFCKTNFSKLLTVLFLGILPYSQVIGYFIT